MVDASGLKSFLPKRNFAANDFVRIPDVPGGLIIQWGVVLKSIPEGVQNVIFPTPFPNFSLMAMATPSNLSGNAGIDVFSQVGAISNSDVNFFFSWVSTATPADGFRWFALGF
ncbi:gp53-like domain-containing protein [Citrobacter freundii]